MEPIFSYGQTVIYNGQEYVIDGVKKRKGVFVYQLKGVRGWYNESELTAKPVEPPAPEYNIELKIHYEDGVSEVLESTDTIGDPTRKFNIEAIPDHATSNVVFDLVGPGAINRSESVAPYALFGDASGVFNYRVIPSGQYTLQVTTNSTSRTITLLVAEEVVTPPQPIDFYIDVPDFTNSRISTDGKKLEGPDWTLPSFASGVYLNNSTAIHQDKRYAFQEIIGTDMKAWNINDDPTLEGTSRAQTTIRLDQPLDVIHMSYEFTLHPDLAHLQMYPDKFNWFSLLEFWTKRDDAMTGNVAGSARWTLGFAKDSVTDKVHWKLDAEWQQPEEMKFVDIWPIKKNRVIPIPFGQRAKLGFYLKFGDNNTGRIIVTLDDNILFDVNDYTMYPNRPDLHQRGLTFYKLYTDDKILDWMRVQGKEISVLYHDFKWYK